MITILLCYQEFSVTAIEEANLSQAKILWVGFPGELHVCWGISLLMHHLDYREYHQCSLNPIGETGSDRTRLNDRAPGRRRHDVGRQDLAAHDRSADRESGN